jgi:hypothetical protein
MKYPNHAALLTLVKVAHAQETPAVSPVRRSLRTWGRYCGMPNAAAANGR